VLSGAAAAKRHRPSTIGTGREIFAAIRLNSKITHLPRSLAK